MLATQLSTFVISVMHSDQDAEVDIVSNAPTFANIFPLALLGAEKTPTCWFFFFGTSIRHFTTSCIDIPITVKRLLISKSPSSYSVMSWHIPILQYISFVAVISHEGCILLDHVQYYKNFCKIKNSEIYRGSFYLHQTEKTLQAGEKILLLLPGGKRKKTLELRVHKYEKISRQTEHFLKLVDPLQMLHSSMCFGYIIRHKSGEGTMRWIP